ncbi:MAG: hypothetical protein QW097_02125 [archaeon]
MPEIVTLEGDKVDLGPKKEYFRNALDTLLKRDRKIAFKYLKYKDELEELKKKINTFEEQIKKGKESLETLKNMRGVDLETKNLVEKHISKMEDGLGELKKILEEISKPSLPIFEVLKEKSLGNIEKIRKVEDMDKFFDDCSLKARTLLDAKIRIIEDIVGRLDEIRENRKVSKVFSEFKSSLEKSIKKVSPEDKLRINKAASFLPFDVYASYLGKFVKHSEISKLIKQIEEKGSLEHLKIPESVGEASRLEDFSVSQTSHRQTKLDEFSRHRITGRPWKPMKLGEVEESPRRVQFFFQPTLEHFDESLKKKRRRV